jgi:hypothetical protein
MKIKTANKFLSLLLICCIIFACGQTNESLLDSKTSDRINKVKRVIGRRMLEKERNEKWERQISNPYIINGIIICYLLINYIRS